jgi:hypothetical protein
MGLGGWNEWTACFFAGPFCIVLVSGENQDIQQYPDKSGLSFGKS